MQIEAKLAKVHANQIWDLHGFEVVPYALSGVEFGGVGGERFDPDLPGTLGGDPGLCLGAMDRSTLFYNSSKARFRRASLQSRGLFSSGSMDLSILTQIKNFSYLTDAGLEQGAAKDRESAKRGGRSGGAASPCRSAWDVCFLSLQSERKDRPNPALSSPSECCMPLCKST